MPRLIAGDRLEPVIKRFSTGLIGVSGAAVVTVTWDTPFPDTNYTVVASLVEGTNGNNLRIYKIQAQRTDGIDVRVVNDGLVATTGTIHAIAVKG